jgi:hypothetical protein
MSGILNLLLSRGAALLKDTYFNLVSLLLNTTSTNGAQNNTFLDSSSNGFTLTRGTTGITQGTLSPFSQTGWSGYFDGVVTSWLFCSGGAGTAMGTGDFTWECWAYVPAAGSYQTFIDSRSSPGVAPSTDGFYFGLLNFAGLAPTIYTASALLTSSINITTNAWNHVAVTRSGTTLTIWVNGSSGGTATNSTNLSNSSFGIGGTGNSNYQLTGYLSNVRITQGGAIYTSAFTPSKTPLTTTVSVGTVSFLSCQSNAFIDKSVNAFPITVFPNSSIQAFSPFAPNNSYSTSVNGGGAYFDGASGSTLSSSNNTIYSLQGDFTVEFWIYKLRNGYATAEQIVAQAALGLSNAGWTIGYNASSNQITFTPRGGTALTTSSTGATTPGQWYHVAVTRQSLTTYMFVNGVLINSGNTSAGNTTTANFTIGGGDNNTRMFNGYLSNLRIIKGQALSTTSFTPPTQPIQSVTDVAWTGAGVAASITGSVSIITNFTNSGIYDAASKNLLLTSGSAQVSTTQSKFGGSSMAFASGTDYLKMLDSPNLRLLAGDFTIDGWVYLSTNGSVYGLVSKGTATTGWSVNITSSNNLQFSYGSSNLTGSVTAMGTGTWYYFAVVRSGSGTGNLKLYLGTTGATTLQATSAGAVTDNFNGTDVLYIGADRSSFNALNGYLDEVRITRYARTITSVPSAAFYGK